MNPYSSVSPVGFFHFNQGAQLYSPVIDPLLIKPLYHLGKARKQPLTKLVSELLFEALSTRQLPAEGATYFDEARALYEPQTQSTLLQEAA